MKRLVVAGVIAAAFCGGPALAAKVLPPPAAAAFSWAGFYVGANGGYEWTDPKTSPIAATQSIPPLAGIGPLTFQADGIFPLTSSVGQSGAIGGLQAGYNWQANAFVAGIEADFDYSSAGQSTVTANCCGPATTITATNISRRLDAFGTLRARLGYAADRMLYYMTGGLAFGESRLAYAAAATSGAGNDGSGLGASTVWQAGWTIGAGLEYAVLENWTVKAEYLHYDLGAQSATVAVASVPAAPGKSWTTTTSVRNNGNIVRGGVNYKF